MILLRQYMRNKKGGASVAIAVIMALVLVFAFIQNIIIREQVLRREDTERLNESIEITSILFDAGQLSFDVHNTGSIPTHLIALWINNTRYEIDEYVNIDKSHVIQDPSIQNTSTIFAVSVFTERGNSDSQTYQPVSAENPPDWWQETTNPIVVVPEGSFIFFGNNTVLLTAINRANQSITIDLLVFTTIEIGGTAAPKVEVINVDWTIPQLSQSQISVITQSTTLNRDGVRVELVSEHNWVVGSYVFIFTEL